MEPTPAPAPAPAKKSNAPMIIAIIAAAILSLCCCLPGMYNFVSPIPYTITTGISRESSSTGTLPVYWIVLLCAAIIPWAASSIFFLSGGRRNKILIAGSKHEKIAN